MHEHLLLITRGSLWARLSYLTLQVTYIIYDILCANIVCPYVQPAMLCRPTVLGKFAMSTPSVRGPCLDLGGILNRVVPCDKVQAGNAE